LGRLISVEWTDVQFIGGNIAGGDQLVVTGDRNGGARTRQATDPGNTAGLVYRQQVVGKSVLWILKCWPVSRICVDLDPDPDKRW
jgi:hypothetical protein